VARICWYLTKQFSICKPLTSTPTERRFRIYILHIEYRADQCVLAHHSSVATRNLCCRAILACSVCIPAKLSLRLFGASFPTILWNTRVTAHIRTTLCRVYGATQAVQNPSSFKTTRAQASKIFMLHATFTMRCCVFGIDLSSELYGLMLFVSIRTTIGRKSNRFDSWQRYMVTRLG
jgi:hypothetical protein